ncbi:hypothetical protein F2Q68_00044914 [Brassica cretica]|uniref:Uncharacterized protein n=1 Tax=Brassica cretica TaxID=69181 RepID=A0A8S9LIS6_BRACR|nr:hypothetical protein F2Q68_00044914 [Brassica cretica]
MSHAPFSDCSAESDDGSVTRRCGGGIIVTGGEEANINGSGNTWSSKSGGAVHSTGETDLVTKTSMQSMTGKKQMLGFISGYVRESIIDCLRIWFMERGECPNPTSFVVVVQQQRRQQEKGVKSVPWTPPGATHPPPEPGL